VLRCKNQAGKAIWTAELLSNFERSGFGLSNPPLTQRAPIQFEHIVPACVAVRLCFTKSPLLCLHVRPHYATWRLTVPCGTWPVSPSTAPLLAVNMFACCAGNDSTLASCNISAPYGSSINQSPVKRAAELCDKPLSMLIAETAIISTHGRANCVPLAATAPLHACMLPGISIPCYTHLSSA